jgi:RNA polymerase sigma-70 factor (family 1)
MLKITAAGLCEDEFKCLFNTYKERLFAYILAVSHSHYIAEEITQEIFIKLWLCRDVLNQVENIEGYIFAMARNKTLNHLRKATHDVKLLNELKDSMQYSGNNVEERTQLSECDKLLQEALTLLSPQRRLVYQLSRNQGLNHQEIAAHLQLSRNTVKNHLVKALQCIRRHVGGNAIITILLPVFFFS